MRRVLRFLFLVTVMTVAPATAASARERASIPPLAEPQNPITFHIGDSGCAVDFSLGRFFNYDLNKARTRQVDVYELEWMTTCPGTSFTPAFPTPQKVQLLLRNGMRIDALRNWPGKPGLNLVPSIWHGYFDQGTSTSSGIPWADSGWVAFLSLPESYLKKLKTRKQWNGIDLRGLVITLGEETHGWKIG